MSEPLLEFNGLARRYGYRWVLKNVSGSLGSKQLAGLAGSNGSGKSTLLNILAGLLRPHKGSIRKSTNVFLLGHEPMLYAGLTARQNLEYAAGIFRADQSKIDFVLEYCGLKSHKNKSPLYFSRGMLQRLAIARILLIQPKIVMFDEPFTGLDQNGQTLLNLILKDRGLAETGWRFDCGILVEHDSAKLEQFSDSLWKMTDQGELVT